jgi:hypothetical protein
MAFAAAVLATNFVNEQKGMCCCLGHLPEDEEYFALLCVRPRIKAHAMLSPRQHSPNLLFLVDEYPFLLMRSAGKSWVIDVSISSTG